MVEEKQSFENNHFLENSIYIKAKRQNGQFWG